MIAVLGVVGLIYALWICFLAIIPLLAAHKAGRTTPIGRVFGYPILFTGYALDFLVNMLLMTVMFFELPREWLVTARVRRHLPTSTGYRLACAKWIDSNWIEPFDPGHCRPTPQPADAGFLTPKE